MVGQLDHWNRILKAYNEYQFHEAADRAYKAEASRKAWNEYMRELQGYEILYGVKWDERDVLIDASNQAVHNYKGDGKIVWLK